MRLRAHRSFLGATLAWSLMALLSLAGARAETLAEDLPNPLTLAWCLERATRVNPELAMNAADAEAAAWRVESAGTLEDPRLSYEASNVPVGEWDFEAQQQQVICVSDITKPPVKSREIVPEGSLIGDRQFSTSVALYLGLTFWSANPADNILGSLIKHFVRQSCFVRTRSPTDPLVWQTSTNFLVAVWTPYNTTPILPMNRQVYRR